MLKAWTTIPVIALAGLFLSCNIINPPEDIPAYIRVDTVLVKTTLFDQGSANHKITCIKVNIGGSTLGFFELPTMVPSLITGPRDLYLEPGVELNGIAGSRIVYPFFRPFVASNYAGSDMPQINFARGEIITVVPQTSYKAECKFAWIEDFEYAGVSFEYPAYSDTTFKNQNEVVREGRFSGGIFLDSLNRFFEGYSSTDFDLPKTGKAILLEFDYKCDVEMEVGLYVIEDGAGIWSSLVVVRPIDHWNRIYVDINSTVNLNNKADLYRPGFRAAWDSTGIAKQSIFMDNLKLIHYK